MCPKHIYANTRLSVHVNLSVYCTCVVTCDTCMRHVGLNCTEHVCVNKRISVYVDDDYDRASGQVLVVCLCIAYIRGKGANGICIFMCCAHSWKEGVRMIYV